MIDKTQIVIVPILSTQVICLKCKKTITVIVGNTTPYQIEQEAKEHTCLITLSGRDHA